MFRKVALLLGVMAALVLIIGVSADTQHKIYLPFVISAPIPDCGELHNIIAVPNYGGGRNSFLPPCLFADVNNYSDTAFYLTNSIIVRPTPYHGLDMDYITYLYYGGTGDDWYRTVPQEDRRDPYIDLTAPWVHHPAHSAILWHWSDGWGCRPQGWDGKPDMPGTYKVILGYDLLDYGFPVIDCTLQVEATWYPTPSPTWGPPTSTPTP